MSHTYNGIEGQGALSQDFLVACHSRSLLASLPVQVSEHHIDLKHKEKTNVFMMESELRLRHEEICQIISHTKRLHKYSFDLDLVFDYSTSLVFLASLTFS